VHGALVIHHACIFLQSLDIIQHLVQVFPESLMTPRDISGKLPLHCAFSNPGTSLELVEYLAEMCPESLTKSDINGRLPIHEACLNGCSLSILKLLVDNSPGSIIEYPDLDESLPIHLALTGGFGGMITAMQCAPAKVIE
jgi:ankyrin repeat protein